VARPSPPDRPTDGGDTPPRGLSVCGALPGPHYRIVDLGNIGGTSGSFRTLGIASDPLAKATRTAFNGLGINDLAQIVGGFVDSEGQVHAFLWSPGDGVSGCRDLHIEAYGSSTTTHSFASDLNCDRIVDGDDLSTVLVSWSESAFCTVRLPCEHCEEESQSLVGGGGIDLADFIWGASTLGFGSLDALATWAQGASGEQVALTAESVMHSAASAAQEES